MNSSTSVIPAQAGILPKFAGVLALCSLLLVSCNEVGIRDNDTDPSADNYDPQAALSSGTSGTSSVRGSSSSYGNSGTSSAKVSSSSVSLASLCAGVSGTCFAYTVAENSAVGTLVGTLSTATSNKWYLLESNSLFTLGESTGSLTLAQNTLDYEGTRSYNFKVRSRDNGSTGTYLFDTAQVYVQVTNVNEAPVLRDTTITIEAGLAEGTAIATLQAQDPDGDAVTYSIVDGNGDFLVNTNTGVVTVWGGLQGGLSYALNIRASDGLLHDSAEIQVIKTSCINTYGTNTVTDCRDNHTYKTKVIGTQTWMVENLAYLPSVNAKADSSSTDAKYYVYDHDGTSVSDAKANSNYTTYGVLYNWPAAMAGAVFSTASPSWVQGACPFGWHLPSDAEWTTLETYVGGSSTAGTKLKANSTLWYYNTGTDDYGFSALPGGQHLGSDFREARYFGVWWTATESSSTYAYARSINHGGADVSSTDHVYKCQGFSVRCVKDN